MVEKGEAGAGGCSSLLVQCKLLIKAVEAMSA